MRDFSPFGEQGLEASYTIWPLGSDKDPRCEYRLPPRQHVLLAGALAVANAQVTRSRDSLISQQGLCCLPHRAVVGTMGISQLLLLSE